MITHRLASSFFRIGLNLQAWLRAEDIFDPENLLPSCTKSVWLLGSAGKEFWHSFQEHIRHHQDWSERSDPLDDFTRHCVADLLSKHITDKASFSLFYPFGEAPWLDFVQMATLAGWGLSSPLGLAIHPAVGPWFGLRVAIATAYVPSEYAIPSDVSVCQECDAPCVQNCPVEAVSRMGWEFERCAGLRVSGEDCQDVCHARNSCPVGKVSLYEPAQLAFYMASTLRTFKQLYPLNKRST